MEFALGPLPGLEARWVGSQVPGAGRRSGDDRNAVAVAGPPRTPKAVADFTIKARNIFDERQANAGSMIRRVTRHRNDALGPAPEN